MKKEDLTLKEIDLMIEKLGGMEGVERLLNNELLIKEIGPFKVWKTIKIGTYKYVHELCRALNRENPHYGISAVNNILDSKSFILSEKIEDINLVYVPVSTLNFKEDATYAEICNRAKKYGLDLCPPETAAQLMLQYEEQPANQRLLIASEPIITKTRENKKSYDILGLINDVAHNLGQRLGWGAAEPSFKYETDMVFIFKISK